jgi:AraC-like DNA-binding protein
LPWLDWEEFGTGHAALRLENDAQIREVLGLFRQAIRLLNHGAPDATDLMYVTVENILLQCNRLRRRTMKHGDPRVEAAIQSVMANLDRPPSLPEMARHVHLSRTQFAHLFQKQTGMGFAAFCTRERMQRAAQLLRFSFQPIKSVAAELGFADPKYFSTSFRRTIGMSPQAYRSGAYGNNARQPVVIS